MHPLTPEWKSPLDNEKSEPQVKLGLVVRSTGWRLRRPMSQRKLSTTGQEQAVMACSLLLQLFWNGLDSFMPPGVRAACARYESAVSKMTARKQKLSLNLDSGTAFVLQHFDVHLLRVSGTFANQQARQNAAPK
mmetsp:Transcript_7373/g.13013  ORF Transcript_7373/g.13013 Transcript_7373/m.13013 type:complete len:134 (-) Transcript_7373:587-988(-)